MTVPRPTTPLQWTDDMDPTEPRPATELFRTIVLSVACGSLSALSLLLPWYAPFWGPGLLFGLLIVPSVRRSTGSWVRCVATLVGSVLSYFVAAFIQGMTVVSGWQPVLLFVIAGGVGGLIACPFCFGLLSKPSIARSFRAFVVGALAGAVFGAILVGVRTNGVAWILVMAFGFAIWQGTFLYFVVQQSNLSTPARMQTVAAAVLVTLAFCFGEILVAVPPRLVSSLPKLHSIVPAGNYELVMEFDQEMDATAPSLQGLSATAPEVVGEFEWQTPTRLVLPVRLEPNRYFVLGGNVKGRLRLRNREGEYARPFVLGFSTGEFSTGKLSEKENRKSLEELRDLLDTRYSYRDVHRVDWDERFREFEDDLISAQHRDEFALLCTALLEPANDGHLWVRNDGLRIPTSEHPYIPNYNWDTLQQVVPNWRKLNDLMFVGKFASGVTYLTVPSLHRTHYFTACKSLGKVWSTLGDEPLIVDLRMNGGGAEPIGQLLAGCVTRTPVVYAQHRSLGEDGNFQDVSYRMLRPTYFAPVQTGRVAVLIGPQNVSSCESFVMMFRQCPNTRLFGQPTRGSSGNPKTFTLANGVGVSLPSWQAMDAEGNLIEGRGIRPDVLIPTDSGDFDDRDPVLEAALEWVNS